MMNGNNHNVISILFFFFSKLRFLFVFHCLWMALTLEFGCFPRTLHSLAILIVILHTQQRQLADTDTFGRNVGT